MKSKARALVEDFGMLHAVGQELANLGWKAAKHSTPHKLGLFFYGDSFVVNAEVEVLNGRLYATGIVKRSFNRDTRHGERTHDEESYLDEVTAEPSESPVEFAQRLHDLYAWDGVGSQSRETFDDEVDSGHGHHKQHPLDRF